MAEGGEGGSPAGGGEAPETYPEAGLCDRCVHADVVRSKRSRFLRCRLADTDPRFPKYPRLPVLACDGFNPIGGGHAPSPRPRE